MISTDTWASRPFPEKEILEQIPGFALIPGDMRDALENFSRQAKKILHPFLSSVESQEPPATLYHYTNDVGLRGILETGQLWLTDIFDLNDPSELRHGFSHAIKILNEKSADGILESKTFARNFEAFSQPELIQHVAPLFMCSFSSHGDDLGQWRAYADNGRGYALAFDAMTLATGFTKLGGTPVPSNSAFHITYDDAQLVGMDHQIIEGMFELLSLPRGAKLQGTAITAYMVSLQILLTLHTLLPALFFKHRAYSNEKEYRFMQMLSKKEPLAVKLRFRPYSLVRYREFNWRGSAAEALTTIVVGPAADGQKASLFAKDCLNSFHHKAVQIVRSEIPYRAL